MIKSTLTLGLDFLVSAYSLARMSDGPKQNPVTSIKNATLLTAAIFAPGRIEFAVSASGVADAAGIDREAKAAVNTLYASNLTAQLVGKKQSPFSFSSHYKRGALWWHAQHGDEALLVNGKTVLAPLPTPR